MFGTEIAFRAKLESRISELKTDTGEGGSHEGMQGSFYAANWLILANFGPNFVIPEISVNTVRKDLACMLGGSGRLFLTACPAPIYFASVHFSRIFARTE